MYFKSIKIENVGPIEKLEIEFPKNGDYPKPIIVVGENGTGKSIFLSHLVNSLVVGKQHFFDDVEVEKGKVYKYRSPSYIKSGKSYSYSSVKFDSGSEVQECQLGSIKADFESTFGLIPSFPIWDKIPNDESSVFDSTFDKHLKTISIIFKEQCCLYFPVNRFEEPAWLNIDNLNSKVNYSELKHISRYSNRNIVSISPLKNNQNWLLDLIFDRQAFEIQTHPIPIIKLDNSPVSIPAFGGYSGQSTKIYDAVLKVLKVILRDDGNIRLGAGTRKNRKISVMKDEKPWVPNLFQLSTGEVQLLNLFLTIVRDYDLSEGQLNNLDDVKGIVIIDEIDSHLHTTHQKEVLPHLISLFPNVQFIITTHSPLFLMGMDQKIGNEDFVIFNMPDGEQLASADFSEFNAAYEAFKETTRHREEIKREFELDSKPIVFVEGSSDIDYITKAAQLLNKTEILERVNLKNGDGSGNLTKIWKAFDNPISQIIRAKIILLYDCDTKKQNKNTGLIYSRVIPLISENPISIGIENLFPLETIDKIEGECPQFIDLKEESTERCRGETITHPATKSINKDEKSNMCKWLCENGNIDDFKHFQVVFEIIEEIINNS